MNIVVLTESLGSGGAERQACILSGEFKRRGHAVCVATCTSADFYGPLLERDRVEHRVLGGRSRIARALNVRRFLRTHGQDVVLVLLSGPAAYSELAGLPWRTWGLVASERLAARQGTLSPIPWLHGLADYVVTNSHSNRLMLEARNHRLKKKLVTIYNAVRLAEGADSASTGSNDGEVMLVVAARFSKQKNVMGLITALGICRDKKLPCRVAVGWYGDQTAEPLLVDCARKEISRLGLGDMLTLHPPTPSIFATVSKAHAVLLPSFFEGLPNSVCEGMALGKPILMSDVADAGNLVQNGVNGFLFDPWRPDSIADAIVRFAELTPEERGKMGKASRTKAEVLFDAGTVAERYLRLLEAAAAHEHVRIDHWPRVDPSASPPVREPRIPES